MLFLTLLAGAAYATETKPIKVFSRIDPKLVEKYREKATEMSEADMIQIISGNKGAWDECHDSKDECIEENLALIELCHLKIREMKQIPENVRDALIEAAGNTPDELEGKLPSYTLKEAGVEDPLSEYLGELSPILAGERFITKMKDQDQGPKPTGKMFGGVDFYTADLAISQEEEAAEGEAAEEEEEASEGIDIDFFHLMTTKPQLVSNLRMLNVLVKSGNFLEFEGKHEAIPDQVLRQARDALRFKGFFIEESDSTRQVWTVQEVFSEASLSVEINAIAKESPIMSEELTFFLSEKVLQIARRLESRGLVCPDFRLAINHNFYCDEDEEEMPLISDPWAILSFLPGPCHFSSQAYHPIDYLLATNVFGYPKLIKNWYGSSHDGRQFLRQLSLKHKDVLSENAANFLNLLQRAYELNSKRSPINPKKIEKEDEVTVQSFLANPFITYWKEQLKKHAFIGKLIESTLFMIHGSFYPFGLTANGDFRKLLNQALKSEYTYKPIKFLQRGAVGAVWLADQLDAQGRIVGQVAIKKTMEKKMVMNSLREALIMRKLKGNHLVEFHQILPQSAQSLYIVMELFRGLELVDFITYSHYDLALLIIHDLAAGVVEMHRRGYAHRDIKPENSYVLASGISKIFDMDAAFHLTNDSHMATEIVGTIEYWSPDIFGVHPFDINTRFSSPVGKPHDLWALGVTAYYLLCKEPLWNEDAWRNQFLSAENRKNLHITHNWLKENCDRHGHHQWNPEGRLENVILGCLNLDKEKRLTAEEVKSRLKEGKDIQALRIKLREHMPTAIQGCIDELEEEQGKLTSRIKILNNEVEELEGDIKDFKNQKDTAEEPILISKLAAEIDQLNKEMGVAISEIKMANDNLEQFTKKKINIEELQQYLASKKQIEKAEIESIKEQIAQFKADEAAFDQEIAKIQQEEDELKNELEDLNAELANLDDDELTLSAELELLEEEFEDLEFDRREKEMNRRRMLEEIEDLEDEIQDVVRQELQIDRNLEEIQSRYASLIQSIPFKVKDAHDPLVSPDQKPAQVEEAIRERGKEQEELQVAPIMDLPVLPPSPSTKEPKTAEKAADGNFGYFRRSSLGQLVDHALDKMGLKEEAQRSKTREISRAIDEAINPHLPPSSKTESHNVEAGNAGREITPSKMESRQVEVEPKFGVPLVKKSSRHPAPNRIPGRERDWHRKDYTRNERTATAHRQGTKRKEFSAEVGPPPKIARGLTDKVLLSRGDAHEEPTTPESSGMISHKQISNRRHVTAKRTSPQSSNTLQAMQQRGETLGYNHLLKLVFQLISQSEFMEKVLEISGRFSGYDGQTIEADNGFIWTKHEIALPPSFDLPTLTTEEAHVRGLTRINVRMMYRFFDRVRNLLFLLERPPKKFGLNTAIKCPNMIAIQAQSQVYLLTGECFPGEKRKNLPDFSRMFVSAVLGWNPIGTANEAILELIKYKPRLKLEFKILLQGLVLDPYKTIMTEYPTFAKLRREQRKKQQQMKSTEGQDYQ